MPMGGGMSQNYQGRKRFIYQEGGQIFQDNDYTDGIYIELTDSEIEEYRRGGYIVEDLE